MRLLPRLLIVLIACLMIIALPAGPAQAYSAYITLSPSTGVPGAMVTISGHNFTPNQYVDIYYYLNADRIWVVDVMTASDGDFEVSFVVPESCNGSHEIFAEDEYGIDAYADFTVETGLIIDPEEGPVGSTVTVEGRGFACNEDVDVMYDDIQVAAAKTDDEGSFSVSFAAPESQRGEHQVTATDAAENKATAIFKIIEGCFIATAAYGTPMAEEIEILRGFRDAYLLTSPVGQALVGLYYRVSPPIAEFITEHPSLKPIVRVGLVPAVAISAVAVNTTPAEKIVIAGLLALVSVALAVWVMRRHRRGPEYTWG